LAACAAQAVAADLARDRPWTGEVRPDPAWLTRQGLAPAYPIQFTIDGAGHASGTIAFTGGSNVTANAKASLDGQLGSDGLNLAATLAGGPALTPPVRAKAQVKVTLTGYPEGDRSVEGVGLIDIADLNCMADPARAAAEAPCPRRLVPIKWSATN
jgi:hypothetical protein